jgi:hypothetical protein
MAATDIPPFDPMRFFSDPGLERAPEAQGTAADAPDARTKGRTLMISRSPARRVTGALKLCLASATIGLRTSRSAIWVSLQGEVTFAELPQAVAVAPRPVASEGGTNLTCLRQLRERDLALERDPDRRADQAGAGHAGEHAGRIPAGAARPVGRSGPRTAPRPHGRRLAAGRPPGPAAAPRT